MKRIITILIGVIILSNGVWSNFYFYNQDEPEYNTGAQVYILNGSGERWDVEGYKIIISPRKILRGHAKLVYKGNPNEIDKSTYYKYEIKERNNDKNETVYSSSSSSNDGSVSILSNLNDVGSITGSYSYDELNKNKQTYESTTMTIAWKDNKGKMHSETIDLEIHSDISINDYE
ncbi:hypothetical protein [Paenibacillus sp. DMB20]|uniref:hypothetical protein n=1 Tax=Paenibacillus sp. DMB20 TaxID=1642570 RepID=UPI000627DDA8|nr:hypothetical protein [Paenibacillus sp. DMB20]KKO54658.1 hypothetical protein XI25_05505 [Paenibacillus sp. DMB20]